MYCMIQLTHPGASRGLRLLRALLPAPSASHGCTVLCSSNFRRTRALSLRIPAAVLHLAYHVGMRKATGRHKGNDRAHVDVRSPLARSVLPPMAEAAGTRVVLFAVENHQARVVREQAQLGPLGCLVLTPSSVDSCPALGRATEL